MEDNTNHGAKQLPREIHKKNLEVQMQQKVHQKQEKDENKKWTTFTYYSPKIRKLTNLFKHTNINSAFKNTNTIQQYAKPKMLEKNQDYNMSGIYRLTCNTCKMSYIGQTSGNQNQSYWNVYDTPGTITPYLPTHNMYYKTYTNTNLLQTPCSYSNPYIRCQC
jgi:hypothetical protein